MSDIQLPPANNIPPTTSLAQPNWRTNLRALYAVAAKDWRQYWRYPLNAVSSVLQPLVWLTPVYFMGLAFSVNGQGWALRVTGTTDYISFILIGTALSHFISAVFWGMGYALKNDMDSGVLESNWLSPISRPVLLIGHTVTNLTVTTITSIVMLAIGALLFGARPAAHAGCGSHRDSDAARLIRVWLHVCRRRDGDA
jgi:ABC-2 type transport system permease protein